MSAPDEHEIGLQSRHEFEDDITGDEIRLRADVTYVVTKTFVDFIPRVSRTERGHVLFTHRVRPSDHQMVEVAPGEVKIVDDRVPDSPEQWTRHHPSAPSFEPRAPEEEPPAADPFMGREPRPGPSDLWQLDSCPECKQRVRDDDPEGLELPSGQRWHVEHLPEEWRGLVD